MTEHMSNHLRKWALMAEVLISEHLSHAKRWERVEVIRRLILRECKGIWAQNSPVWVNTLLELLNAVHHESGSHGGYIDHKEARATLRLFVETCNYFIRQYDSMWFSHAHKRYSYTTGEEDTPKTIKPDSPFDTALDDIPW